MSCIDGEEGGWSLDDTVAMSRELVARGVDLIDCSSRGIGLSPTARVLSRVPGFQVPFAERVRHEVSVPTMAVGLILTGHQAESILSDGRADLICIAREALRNPSWALHAVQELGGDPEWALWPPQYGWWLSRRAGQLRLGEKDISEGRMSWLSSIVRRACAGCLSGICLLFKLAVIPVDVGEVLLTGPVSDTRCQSAAARAERPSRIRP